MELGADDECAGLRFVSTISHPTAHSPDCHITILRPLASLFFGNAHAFRAVFHDLIRRNRQWDGKAAKGGSKEQWLLDVTVEGPRVGVDGGWGGVKAAGNTRRESEQAESAREARDGRMEDGEAGLGRPEGEREGRGRGSRRVEYILVDCCAVKILDLTAMGALAEVRGGLDRLDVLLAMQLVRAGGWIVMYMDRHIHTSTRHSSTPASCASSLTPLPLSAFRPMRQVVDDCQCHHVTVLFSNCSHSLKTSLQACQLLSGLGGDLVTLSTEEVYALLVASHEYNAVKATAKSVDQRR